MIIAADEEVSNVVCKDEFAICWIRFALSHMRFDVSHRDGGASIGKGKTGC